MALNAYYGKRKIALVAVNGTPLAQKVAQEMQEQGMSDTTVLDVPKAYLDYYTLAQLQPEYVLFIYEGTKCKVKTTKIEEIAGDRLGHMVRRNTEASKEAQGIDLDLVPIVLFVFLMCNLNQQECDCKQPQWEVRRVKAFDNLEWPDEE